MTNRVVKAGTVFYEAGKDVVRSLDIVAKGTVKASRVNCSIDIPAGGVIGIGEDPLEPYTLTYEAEDDVSLFSYPYESEASLVALFKANPKLLSTLVSGAARFAKNLQSAALDAMEQARTRHARIMEAAAGYKNLAVSLGVPVKDFGGMSALPAPNMLDPARGWHRDFVEDLCANEAKLKKDFFSIPSLGLGIGLTVNTYALESRAFASKIFDYIGTLEKMSSEFMTEYNNLKSRAESGDSAVSAQIEDDPSIHNCLETIMEFCAPDHKILDRFDANIRLFKKSGDRYGSDDMARRLRRDISGDFYELYTAVFLEAVQTDWNDIPVGVRMFLLFGYVDEDLAGAENAVKLAGIARTVRPGRDTRVVTIFEWLTLIYRGKTVPSKNEFDLEYPAYLRSLRQNGDISEMEEQRLLSNRENMLRYEIKNMFATGNRMTYGQITTFVPVFDGDHVIKKIEQAYLDSQLLGEKIEAIRNIDPRAFCRQGVFSLPEAGVNAYYTIDEVLPYIILMPNIGSRASLWQEIDSKKRSTPGRMIISILHTENLDDTLFKLVGDFRWEMCKTEQGVHWNDITDPSLTSMYCDYLQFYRKNSALSTETKEKISIALKNNSNNFKKVFVSDYVTYMKYEATGALRLTKAAREILFAYCPFAASIREKLADNPQFTQLIKLHDNKVQAKQKTLQNLFQKIGKTGNPIPQRLRDEMEFLEK
ncbi:MAG: hypothetical protein K6C95_10165 [Lachnospiraceae bacterium]|nr:hypothetical protein [Lachnospiraceae bacterium]